MKNHNNFGEEYFNYIVWLKELYIKIVVREFVFHVGCGSASYP